jgi:hypothetical protein
VQQPERGCPLPALTAEVARADPAVRQAFQEGLLQVHARLQRITGSAQAAWSLIAQNVGAVMLARALPDEKLQRRLLAAARRSGWALLRAAPADARGPKAGRPGPMSQAPTPGTQPAGDPR